MGRETFILSIDLGTTNVEAQLFDHKLNCIKSAGFAVEYERDKHIVEFSPPAYIESLFELLKRFSDVEIAEIVLTGQAESLVLLDKNMEPIGNIISWMDERSFKECDEIRSKFTLQDIYAVTGQTDVITTWPATKILHLKKHNPAVFAAVDKFVMLKDFVAFILTGKLFADKSIATFSLLFDIYQGCYWKDMLEFLGISEGHLPELIEPGTNIGTISCVTAGKIGQEQTKVNVGTLDHLAGLIGTGNIGKGMVTESTGTVLAVSAFSDGENTHGDGRLALHYGPYPGSHVYISVIESGGLCLDWFLTKVLDDMSYQQLEEELGKRSRPGNVIFLPYLTGTNAPEFDHNTVGSFYGLKVSHDRFDLALAVLEGLAIVLNKNVGLLEKTEGDISRIISTGGGAKSKIWNQIKADVTGKTVTVPKRTGVACLGAAIIGAVDSGLYQDLQSAVESAVAFSETYEPSSEDHYSEMKDRFNSLYQQMVALQNKEN